MTIRRNSFSLFATDPSQGREIKVSQRTRLSWTSLAATRKSTLLRSHSNQSPKVWINSITARCILDYTSLKDTWCHTSSFTSAVDQVKSTDLVIAESATVRSYCSTS